MGLKHGWDEKNGRGESWWEAPNKNQNTNKNAAAWQVNAAIK